MRNKNKKKFKEGHGKTRFSTHDLKPEVTTEIICFFTKITTWPTNLHLSHADGQAGLGLLSIFPESETGSDRAVLRLLDRGKQLSNNRIKKAPATSLIA